MLASKSSLDPLIAGLLAKAFGIRPLAIVLGPVLEQCAIAAVMYRLIRRHTGDTAAFVACLPLIFPLQPEANLLAFTGNCLIHRAEIMQRHGSWPEALEEARRAGERLAQTENEAAAGQAFYRAGELHRLRGCAAAAEEAYREASRCGCVPSHDQ